MNPAPSASASPSSPAAPPAGGAPAAPAASATPPPPAAPPTPDPRDAAFAQRERALVAKQQEWQKQQAAFQQQKQQIEAQAAELAEVRKLLDRAKVDPDAVSRKLWGDDYYDMLTQRRTGTIDPAAIDARVEDRVSALKRELAEQQQKEKQEATARQQQEEQAFLANLKREVSTFVDKNADRFELTKVYGQENMIIDVMNEEAARTGRVPSYEEAAEKVERLLEEAGEKYAASKRYSARRAAAEQKTPPSADNSSTPAPIVSPTISDRMAATMPSSEDIKPLNIRERIAIVTAQRRT